MGLSYTLYILFGFATQPRFIPEAYIKRVPESFFGPQIIHWKASHSVGLHSHIFSKIYIKSFWYSISWCIDIFSFFSITKKLKERHYNISASFQADHCMLLYQIGFCQGSLFVAENPGLKWVFRIAQVSVMALRNLYSRVYKQPNKAYHLQSEFICYFSLLVKAKVRV